jgi:glycosyltransferase involved in cell wall biosynthesis
MNSLAKFDHVLLTSIQKFDKALVFFGSPFQDVSFSGIYLGVKFHLSKYGILYQPRFNYLEKQFFKRLLYISTLQNIITNDHLLKNYLQSEKWKNCDKLHFLHDPKEFNFNFDKFYSRKRLDIPKKSIVILVYGALIESKGIPELLSIFNNKKLNTNIRIILAGKQLLNKKSFSLNNNFINKLKLQKKIFIFNSWISEKKEALLFSAADIVWLGYKNYSTPSGVFYQATQRCLPPLISNDGLINNLNKIVKVGYSINIYNSLNIIEGINYLLNKKNRSKLKKNILKFSRISESRKWVSNFKKIHSKIFY